MRTIDAGVLANITAGFSSERLMVRLDLASGSVGFWQGDEPYAHGGVTYQGFGSLLEADPFEEGNDFSSAACTVRLRALPVQFLTPDRLSAIETEDYHQRPAFVSVAHMNPATGAVLFVEPIFTGRVDVIEHRQESGAWTLQANLESLARDYTSAGHREQSDADQKALDAADTGLIYAATAGRQEIYWGSRPPGGLKGLVRDIKSRARPTT